MKICKEIDQLLNIKLKNYKIETIDQRGGHYRKVTMKNVAKMTESAHHFIFVTIDAGVIRRRKDTWRWVE